MKVLILLGLGELLVVVFALLEWYQAWCERRLFRTWVALLLVAICFVLLMLLLGNQATPYPAIPG